MGNTNTNISNIITEYDMNEVKKHCKKNDAWLVIDGYVYDVSNFNHPGGDIISIGYGQDASEKFHNENVRHSSRAKKLLKTMQIGKLKKINNMCCI